MRLFATTLESVTSNKTKTTVKLSMSNKDAAVFAQKYLQSIDKELQVSFDDPQMELDLTYPEKPHTGIQGKIDSSGVVETVQNKDVNNDLFQQGDELKTGREDEEDEDADLFVPETDEQESEGEHAEEEGEQEEQTDVSADREDDGSDDEALIESIDRGDYRPDAPVQEPDKEQIEDFIIREEPKFEDIPFNFAELLQKKRSGKTWVEIANDLNTRSTVISAALTKVKDRVKQIMMNGVA